ncbi:MAG TPA: hypothetical protein VFN38_03030 [Gemmatimonadaceae bacterium]|nr:hypothetical protein [Gemmatimonadaceae bacterium]
MNPRSVSAVLVTKGDHDLSEITDSISAAGVTDIVVWNNAERENLMCYGRYAGIADARNEFIYHQDDDCVVPVADIIAAYDSRTDIAGIVANNREEEEWPLTGLGSVFHRSLADASFDRYIELFGYDEHFLRTCDVVFASQHPYRKIVLGYRELEWSRAPDRMYLQPGHMAARELTLARMQALAA